MDASIQRTENIFRKIKIQNALYKKLQSQQVFNKLDILDNVSDEQIEIDPSSKIVVVKNNVSHISLMKYLYNKWYKDSYLCRFRFPFKIEIDQILKYDGWDIQNKDRVFFPEDVQALMDKGL
jgi:hypothetical protein